jgi:hypothetical protein
LTHVIEESQHVSLNALGRLLSNLQRALKERNGEVRMRAGRKVESEVRVVVFLENVVNHGLKLREKRD